jgi:uncharacterized metal-binding protein
LSKPQFPVCAKCPVRICFPGGPTDYQFDVEKAPDFCPAKLNTSAIEKAWGEYQKDDVLNFARQASIQEFQCYESINGETITKIPRIEETTQFAQKMGYEKLGIVFCGGLADETLILNKILENKGFKVVSVCCKAGGIAKERIGIKPEEKIVGPDSYESMCNPIAQAEIMNDEMIDLVIMIGLCIGHDTLFLEYCKRPVTVLAVKDRVLAHNPLGALYLSASPYYNRLMSKK